MKKLFATLVVLALTISTIATFYCFAAITPKVKVDGKELTFSDQAPFVATDTGRTLIPVRAVAEACGADVEWSQSTQKVTIKYQNTLIQLQIGANKLAKKDVGVLDIEQAPIIVNGRTMIPARAVFEALGMYVDWDNVTQTVLITTQSSNGNSVETINNNNDTQALNGAVIPDLQAFSGNACSHNAEIIMTTSTKQCYFSSNNAKFIKEYINLIDSLPDFKLRAFQDDEWIFGEGSGSGQWAYDYIGSEIVESFNGPGGGPKDSKDIELYIRAWAAGDSIQFDIIYADGISYVDTGHRTKQKLVPYGSDNDNNRGDSNIPDYENNIPEFAELDCLTCKGSGDCQKCGGNGMDYYGDHKTDCTRCNGSGNCKSCGGSGKR